MIKHERSFFFLFNLKKTILILRIIEILSHFMQIDGLKKHKAKNSILFS
jgi:hypothetical protein